MAKTFFCCWVEPFYADVAADLQLSNQSSSFVSPAHSTQVSIGLHFLFHEERYMDPAIEADLDRQQSSMLEKLYSIIDNKLDSIKRQLKETSNT